MSEEDSNAGLQVRGLDLAEDGPNAGDELSTEPLQSPFLLAQVPPELISYIFDASVKMTEDEDDSDDGEDEREIDLTGFTDTALKARQAITLSSISHDLRNLALSTPTLWVYMYESMKQEGIDVFAIRSGGCPLQVRLLGNTDSDDEDEEMDDKDIIDMEALRRICQHSARWGAVYITAGVTKPLVQYASSLPILRHLKVANEYGRSERGYVDSQVPKWEQRLKDWPMPNITSFWGMLAMPTVLDFFSINKIALFIQLPDEPENVANSIRRLLAVLAPAGKLEQLVLVFDSGGNKFKHVSGMKAAPINLPHLRTFHITLLENTGPYYPVIELLTLPNVRIVNIRLPEQYIPSALKQLARSPRIETMTLARVESAFPAEGRTTINLMNILRTMRGLQRLQIKKLQLSTESDSADDLTKTTNVELIPPSLHSVGFSNVSVRFSDLEKFLDILRDSTAWPRFRKLKVDLADAFGEMRSPHFDEKLCGCDGKVEITAPVVLIVPDI